MSSDEKQKAHAFLASLEVRSLVIDAAGRFGRLGAFAGWFAMDLALTRVTKSESYNAA